MAGSLLMLAYDRRVRAVPGHVQPDRRGHERQRLGLPRLPRRLRGQGSAPAVPRLAADRLHRGSTRGGRTPLGRGVEGSRVRSRLDRAPALSGSCRGLAHCRARARRGWTRLQLAARVPPTGRARRDRVLVDGPDEPDRAGYLRGERPRPRRRNPPLGQSRPRLRCDVPARRDADPPYRHRPLLRPRGLREGPPRSRHDRDGGRSYVDARPFRARPTSPANSPSSPASSRRAGATPRSVRRRSCSPPCTPCG